MRGVNVMQISLKKIKGLYLYEAGSTEPCGVVKGVYFSTETGLVDAILAETVSLIPINKTICIHDIDYINNRKAVLKNGIAFINNEKFIKEQRKKDVFEDKISNIVQGNSSPRKIRDMQFEFETGEITEIIVDNGFLRKKNKIPINKMKIKDNTIYIEGRRE